MHPYIGEALVAEHVRSLHAEAAARRQDREARRPARFRWTAYLRGARRPARAAHAVHAAAEPACKPAT